MLSIPGQHPQQQQQHPQHPQQHHPQQVHPQQHMQQPGYHPQTPQRHISPMNARATPQTPHHHQVQVPGPHPHHPQPGYYTPGPTPRQPPMPSGAAPPSAKRYKPNPANAPHPGSAAAQAAQAITMNAVGGDPNMTIDEEEDTSRGDILDHLTPREIAQTRYTQHHEWMEEIIGSVYPINRITPVDLGLGLVGDLESVTRGLLDPPVYPTPKTRSNDPVKEAKDPKELLASLKANAVDKIKALEEEMRVMAETHEARMNKIKSTATIFRDAEFELRGGLGLENYLPGLHVPHATDGDSDSEDPSSSLAPAVAAGTGRPIPDVIRDVEAKTGWKIVPAQPVVRYELPAEEIIKMGGVVAQEIQQHQHHPQHHPQQHDTVMDDDDVHALDDDDAAFKLDIPTPHTNDSPAADAGLESADNTAGGLLDEFQATRDDDDTALDDDDAVLDDTIMADFLDDTLSKPTSPHGDQTTTTTTTIAPEQAEELFAMSPGTAGAGDGGGVAQ
ncbi:hypothetical protein BZA05DRAFT_39060 [Tricharina praecox]|uniref:uncharacterized protein n=1 Tax=Tricharina praecox TaxID=43433 RepID=UPI00221FA5B4|nr:uncharacterized protein BZA05DRAFT_39060 [Tricharina praecox]KAI5852220.1 hypothetical protein BZA05DRAFT_39060 [Tricharina praecox]